jgi:beta-galactosidase
MGRGGVNSWGAEPLNAYRLNANREYSHKFRIAPIRKQLNDPTEYSLLGFRNFGWNDLPATKYPGDDIYKNQPEKDITDDTDNNTEKPEAIPYHTAEIPVDNTVRHYNVFDLQGRLVARFKTVGIEDLQAKTAAAVSHSGMYLVKSKAGVSFRINVR